VLPDKIARFVDTRSLTQSIFAKESDGILDISLDQARLEAMPVHEYVDLLVI